ncbi:hypothetical protein [Streptomyces malaysiensis]|uniref:Uncharacterized protein n=1 Tax=Streptomyces malaysiensis TaxID=92644 RepID=A0A2J7Z8H4_STRMQ|nr:hypothetical protein [Streptomyces malaysiensis]PNG96572.1 hypothetical protein SMF913_12597 [Streptomyces malaysiensis]
MPRINKIKRDKAIAALTAAGMAPSTAARYVRMLDLDSPLKDQVIALAEDLPDLFGDATDESGDTEDDETMTAQEAKRARARGLHPLLPERGEGTPAQRNAHALGATKTRPERPSTAPATARKAAEILTRGIGNAADR